MSRFTRKSQVQIDEVTKIEVDGTFLCQICGEAIDNALYLPEASVLIWKCSQAHVSNIEKFVL